MSIILLTFVTELQTRGFVADFKKHHKLSTYENQSKKYGI